MVAFRRCGFPQAAAIVESLKGILRWWWRIRNCLVKSFGIPLKSRYEILQSVLDHHPDGCLSRIIVRNTGTDNWRGFKGIAYASNGLGKHLVGRVMATSWTEEGGADYGIPTATLWAHNFELHEFCHCRWQEDGLRTTVDFHGNADKASAGLTAIPGVSIKPHGLT